MPESDISRAHLGMLCLQVTFVRYRTNMSARKKTLLPIIKPHVFTQEDEMK